MSRFFRAVLWRTAVYLTVILLSTVVVLVVLPGILRSLKFQPPEPGLDLVGERSVLVFDLALNLVETPSTFGPGVWLDSAVLGQPIPTLTVFDVVRTLEAAADDERITALYLRGNLLPEAYGSGLGAVEEVRRAILVFAESGKPVIGHFSFAGPADFYLYSACDELYLSPLGGFDFNGVASEMVYFGNAFERYGIVAQGFQAGDYKGGVEPFVREAMSQQGREQNRALVDSLWETLVEDVAAQRNIDAGALRSLLESQPLGTTEWAVQRGLATGLLSEGDVIEKLYQYAEYDEERGSFTQVSVPEYAKWSKEEFDPDRETIAVVYLEGEMLSGEGLVGTVGGDWFARELRYLQGMENLKGVVLRINSPGGSAEAAETLVGEIRRIAAAVPLVVSMSSYAASGGYWVALDSSRILANRTTITGSIGVFGLHLSIAGLANRFGLAFDGVRSSPHADAGSLTRELTGKESAAVQREVEKTYNLFLYRVGEGRNLDWEQIRSVADGRVWTGRDAERRGLTDATGGLREALVAVYEAAGMEVPERPLEGNIAHLPQEYTAKDFLEDLLESPRREAPVARADSSRPGLLGEIAATLDRMLGTWNDPRHVYARLPWKLQLR